MKRVYHHYQMWEDFRNGMWKNIQHSAEPKMLQRAIEFTGDAELYGSYMMRVIAEWPNACEHNLTNDSMNRLAWVGHAACSMAIKCPEYITRRAWGMLTEEQRVAANRKAELAVATWMLRYRSRNGQYAIEF